MNRRISFLLFIAGLLLLAIPDMIVFYLIMPVPTSQQTDQMELGHFLYQLLWYTRIIGLLLIIPPLLQTWKSGSMIRKVVHTVLAVIALAIVYILGYRFMPENVFKEPKQKIFTTADKNTVPENNYVLGVEVNGEAKAYPLKFVGYHHKIQDSVGGKPVLVTFCTMCRTGMVYDPIINGKHQEFRLVGAAFNNAVIEDEETKSWWYQSTGIAGAGPLKGTAMQILPYSQMTLAAWIKLHPNTLIMQPDPHFTKEYAKLKNYDINIPGANTDPAKNKTFQPNSWVIGVLADGGSKVFLWNELTDKKVLNDSVGNTPVVISLEADGYSFHSWKRTLNDTTLNFQLSADGLLTDVQTGSAWNWKGECTAGSFTGKKLSPVTAFQTYYHSWERFYAGKHSDGGYSIDHNQYLTLPSDKRSIPAK